ncbi:unnamed protein product [Rodentolepis nana]|uniref:Enhancer of polycomb-like protein n=1 Tax=Rodentolepis nana TaxID=102285 RepID=A0A0R3T3E2_RODNA|nr:unnamed protein product [Rodentolepis nana]
MWYDLRLQIFQSSQTNESSVTQVQILVVEGAVGRPRKSIYYALPHTGVFPHRFEYGHQDSLDRHLLPKRDFSISDSWDLDDDDLIEDDDLTEANDAVMASAKTALTEEEAQKYLAQMKAYYLKNGMPRFG